jgi:hypothetical protein
MGHMKYAWNSGQIAKITWKPLDGGGLQLKHIIGTNGLLTAVLNGPLN